jgi:hypothetical protein
MMRKSLLLFVMSTAVSGLCSASSLFVTGTGTFSATDTADPFVTPNDVFSLQFVVPDIPTITGTNSTTLSFDVPVEAFTYDLNGTVDDLVPQPTEITFYTADDGGGFAVAFGSSTEFLFSSSQIFSGTTAAPAFSPGTFDDQSFLFLDQNNGDSNPATVTVAPTPEPSSILLLLAGLVGLCAFAARKSARVAGSVHV